MKNVLLHKIIAILMIIGIMSTSICTVFASEVDDKKAEQNKINQSLKDAKNALNEIKENANEAKTDLDKINDQLIDVQNELESLKIKLNEVNGKIEEKQNEIEKEEKEIEAKEKLLKERMVALYEAGDVSYLDVLLNSESILDFISGYNAIQTIVEADTNLINLLEEKKAKLELDKKELESDKQKVEELKKEQEIKNSNLVVLKESKNKELSKLNEEEKAKQAEIDDYNAAMARVNSELAEAMRKAQEQASGSGGSGGGNAGLKFDGSFIWPCDCKIVTSRMKFRWGRWHKGIDIGAYYANVYASASGYAYNAYDRYGYGNYVMVVHGGGYVTLYGHLSSSHVSNGQYVSQGQVIATSGNTGASQGPHLHFEIRQASSISDFFGNNWLNPLDYLPGGYSIQE